MVSIDLVGVARRIATQAHAGKVDKAGKDYILHPQAVARAMAAHGTAMEAAGWLHDVLEDTVVSAGDLLAQGIPEDVVRLVEAVTRREGEGYLDDFIPRIIIEGGPRAVALKLADIAHNLAPGRATLKPSQRERYQRAEAMLRGALRGWAPDEEAK